ncbi:galactoside alpha-(1,2)-fucosyltransferase 2-like [Rana temporaria]|uniref:galactoside alpha-(1,2)-fucosyltransferase 2-like n=1 Tax=Rana temporaria TaxID=8407 RepID=UPI001AACC972|nr:galactoside alpha-(1,2)-fucosyltransferase 2-like [Rana temporaria]XP_040204126.1 galactoside alpha-(1,2)-fucosyltransferase 2-like [Rana temporaria]XP_040204127.1 galactoside alpha-(1,2)-fucosyltransferase 2-like [Rana temporaria]
MDLNLKKTAVLLLVYAVIVCISWYYFSWKSIFHYKYHENSSCRQLPIKVQSDAVMWTARLEGRFGNRIGEYAVLYALAKLNGHQAYILPEMHNELGRIFKIKLPVLHQEIAKQIKWRGYELNNWMLPEYANISGQYVKLIGAPCSWTFYHHIREEILQEFTFQDHIKEEANVYLANLKGNRENVTFVGVHVRRGDYVEIMANSWKGVVADKNYMQKAMDYFRKKYDNPLFVVTSNGMDWCKQNINTSLGDVHFAGYGVEGSPARDFALLAHCNHTIMTIGTFGYWAAYLAGGETIYLTNYTLPDSFLLTILRYEASFLPEWIGIPADLSPQRHP